MSPFAGMLPCEAGDVVMSLRTQRQFVFVAGFGWCEIEVYRPRVLNFFAWLFRMDEVVSRRLVKVEDIHQFDSESFIKIGSVMTEAAQ